MQAVFPVRLAAWFTLIGGLAAPPLVQAQPGDELQRGELLYTTHCVACHTTQMHWRDKRLVTDWSALKAQVRQWQDTAGLGWNEADITRVALYLNQRHYGFQVNLYGRAASPGAPRTPP